MILQRHITSACNRADERKEEVWGELGRREHPKYSLTVRERQAWTAHLTSDRPEVVSASRAYLVSLTMPYLGSVATAEPAVGRGACLGPRGDRVGTAFRCTRRFYGL